MQVFYVPGFGFHYGPAFDFYGLGNQWVGSTCLWIVPGTMPEWMMEPQK